MTDHIDFTELGEITMRAFLCSTEFEFEERRMIDGRWEWVACKERMSDQARRVGLAICALSFARRREGVWLPALARLAKALAMDESDCRRAVRKLVKWRLMKCEEREDGVWLQLAPSRMTLHDRALGAGRAFAELEELHLARCTPELIERSCAERRDAGELIEAALASVSAESRGDSPDRMRGDSRNGGDSPEHERGRFPCSGEIPPLRGGGDSPARAPRVSVGAVRSFSSFTEPTAPESYVRSGAVSPDDAEASPRIAALRARLEKLDPGDFNAVWNGRAMNKERWEARLAADPDGVEMAVREAEEIKRGGRSKAAPLGVAYNHLPKWLKEVGRALRSWMLL